MTGNVGKYEMSYNLFDFSTIETGYRIQWATGALYPDDTAIMSDYIPVTNSRYRTDVGYFVLGYDENYTYFGACDSTNQEWVKSFTNPTTYILAEILPTIKYIRLLSYGTYTSITSTTMLNKGNNQIPYEPHGKIWHDLQPKIYMSGTWSDSTNNPKKYDGSWT